MPGKFDTFLLAGSFGSPAKGIEEVLRAAIASLKPSSESNVMEFSIFPLSALYHSMTPANLQRSILTPTSFSRRSRSSRRCPSPPASHTHYSWRPQASSCPSPPPPSPPPTLSAWMGDKDIMTSSVLFDPGRCSREKCTRLAFAWLAKTFTCTDSSQHYLHAKPTFPFDVWLSFIDLD